MARWCASHNGTFPFLLLVVLLTGIHPLPARAAGIDSLQVAPRTSPDVGDTIVTDIKESWGDALLFFSAPARFTLRDWGTVGWVVAGTGMSMAADDPMRTFFLRRHGTTGDMLADWGTMYGNWPPALIISVGLYSGGLIFDSPGVRRAGRSVVQSVLYAGVITTVLKGVIGRHRPFLNDGPFAFNGPSIKDEFNSLPSGHSTWAFALSSSLACDIDNPWATVGLYGVATVTALSRIYKDRHWLSDVFLGAAIGTVSGYGVHHLHDRAPDAMGLYIAPTLNGVMLSYRF